MEIIELTYRTPGAKISVGDRVTVLQYHYYGSERIEGTVTEISKSMVAIKSNSTGITFWTLRSAVRKLWKFSK